MGYHRAGWDVLGIDLHPQPRYPFAFIQMDVLKADRRLLALADGFHASPPCQFGTELNSDKGRHLNLIPQTREMLRSTGAPYVIENVRAVKGHLIEPVSLFGTMFDCHLTTSAGQRFDLSRERAFETNWKLRPPRDPGSQGRPLANVYGGHLRCRSGEFRTGKGTGRTVDFPGEDRGALARSIMGMPWATMNGMSEAVPPAFTACIGFQMLRHVTTRTDAPPPYEG